MPYRGKMEHMMRHTPGELVPVRMHGWAILHNLHFRTGAPSSVLQESWKSPRLEQASRSPRTRLHEAAERDVVLVVRARHRARELARDARHGLVEVAVAVLDVVEPRERRRHERVERPLARALAHRRDRRLERRLALGVVVVELLALRLERRANLALVARRFGLVLLEKSREASEPVSDARREGAPVVGLRRRTRV